MSAALCKKRRESGMNRKFFGSWAIVGFGLNCLWLSSVLWFRGELPVSTSSWL